MLHFLWKIVMKLRNPSCKIRCAEIGLKVKLERKVTLQPGSHIYAAMIGKYTFINKNVIIDKSCKAIGRFCSIAYGAKIGLGTHPIDWVSSHSFAYKKAYGLRKDNLSFEGEETSPTLIGHDVWIGANAIILEGVKVGHGAIIGANALVNKEVEPYSIVVGSPAKHLRYRFDEETVAKLLKLNWWDWEESVLKERLDDFQDPAKILKWLK